MFRLVEDGPHLGHISDRYHSLHIGVFLKKGRGDMFPLKYIGNATTKTFRLLIYQNIFYKSNNYNLCIFFLQHNAVYSVTL